MNGEWTENERRMNGEWTENERRWNGETVSGPWRIMPLKAVYCRKCQIVTDSAVSLVPQNKVTFFCQRAVISRGKYALLDNNFDFLLFFFNYFLFYKKIFVTLRSILECHLLCGLFWVASLTRCKTVRVHAEGGREVSLSFNLKRDK